MRNSLGGLNLTEQFQGLERFPIDWQLEVLFTGFHLRRKGQISVCAFQTGPLDESQKNSTGKSV